MMFANTVNNSQVEPKENEKLSTTGKISGFYCNKNAH